MGKSLGQFFTPKPIREILFSKLLKIDSPLILEPSVGTGEFLDSIYEYFKNPKIDAFDIDKNLVKISSSKFPFANIKCGDFLELKSESKYDFVIGNPPYFEIKLESNQKEKFHSIINGRVNIFGLFVYKGLQFLKEGGYLAYVLPPSMNGGAYFSKLREYIIKNSNIEYLNIFKEQYFDANQTVMILILKKGIIIFLNEMILLYFRQILPYYIKNLKLVNH